VVLDVKLVLPPPLVPFVLPGQVSTWLPVFVLPVPRLLLNTVLLPQSSNVMMTSPLLEALVLLRLLTVLSTLQPLFALLVERVTFLTLVPVS